MKAARPVRRGPTEKCSGNTGELAGSLPYTLFYVSPMILNEISGSGGRRGEGRKLVRSAAGECCYRIIDTQHLLISLVGPEVGPDDLSAQRLY